MQVLRFALLELQLLALQIVLSVRHQQLLFLQCPPLPYHSASSVGELVLLLACFQQRGSQEQNGPQPQTLLKTQTLTNPQPLLPEQLQPQGQPCMDRQQLFFLSAWSV